MAQEQGRFSMDVAIERFERELRHDLELLDAANRKVDIRNAVKKFAGELAGVRLRAG